MGEVRNIKYKLKPVGLVMDELVEKIQKKYEEKHSFMPPYYLVLNWISEAVSKKGLSIV